MEFKELIRREAISPLEVFDYISEGYWKGQLMKIIEEEGARLGERVRRESRLGSRLVIAALGYYIENST